MPEEIIPPTQIAQKIQQAMDERGITLQDLAKHFDMSYEYMRRTVRGETNPSKNFLKLLCLFFGWDAKEMEVLLIQDKFRKHNGPLTLVAQGINPETEPFVRGWDFLEQSQKDILLAQLKMFIEQNRRYTRDTADRTV